MESDVKYGTYGVVTTIEDKIQCHICGKTFNKLGAHAWMYHHITSDNYREMMGLCSRTKLLSSDSLDILRERWYQYEDIQRVNLEKGAEYRFINDDIRIPKKRKIGAERYIKLVKLAEDMRNKRGV